MRNRFLFSIAVADVLALTVAVFVATGVVFQAFPWNASTGGVSTLWPLLGFFYLGSGLGTLISSQSWRHTAPRPSYGRALTIVTIGTVFTAIMLVGTGAYRSRLFFAIVPAVWFLGSVLHRAWWRQRPWSEKMILVTGEHGLIAELNEADHADVLYVLDPLAAAPDLPPDKGVTLVTDLRAVLSESMAKYVSSCSIGGTTVRALTTVYEEHTGRFPPCTSCRRMGASHTRLA